MAMLHLIRQNRLKTLNEKFYPMRLTHQTWLFPISTRLHRWVKSRAFAEQRFGLYEDVKKWLDEWFAAKGEDFYWRGRKMEKMYNKRWSILQIKHFKTFFRIFFERKRAIHTCNLIVQENLNIGIEVTKRNLLNTPSCNFSKYNPLASPSAVSPPLLVEINNSKTVGHPSEPLGPPQSLRGDQKNSVESNLDPGVVGIALPRCVWSMPS